MATVKKIKNADRSYGRGVDSYYSPAMYGVFDKEGHRVARITASNSMVYYMEKIHWTVITEDEMGRVTKVAYHSSFKNAKKYAEENF